MGFAFHLAKVAGVFLMTLALSAITGLAIFWGDTAPASVQWAYILGLPLLAVAYVTRPAKWCIGGFNVSGGTPIAQAEPIQFHEDKWPGREHAP